MNTPPKINFGRAYDEQKEAAIKQNRPDEVFYIRLSYTKSCQNTHFLQVYFKYLHPTTISPCKHPFSSNREHDTVVAKGASEDENGPQGSHYFFWRS